MWKSITTSLRSICVAFCGVWLSAGMVSRGSVAQKKTTKMRALGVVVVRLTWGIDKRVRELHPAASRVMPPPAQAS